MAVQPSSTSLPVTDFSHLTSDTQVILPFILDHALHIVGAAAILIFGFWLSGKADLWVGRSLRRSHHVDNMLQGFFSSIARYFVLTVTTLAVLSEFGIQTTSLVAVLGAASLAVGLALQGTLSNLAAGVMLLIFRPFRIGHSVTVGGNTGTVRNLTLFWTEIVTDGNVQIIIPNAGVWGQAIRNMSTYQAPVATAELRVPVPTGGSLHDVCRHVAAITAATPHVLATPVPHALLDRSAADNSMQIVITFAAEGDNAAQAKSDILRMIDDQLEPHPGPTIPSRQPETV